ncbi:Ribonucleotide reductase of class III (anaerobic), activating protein [Mucinivorans hirudinis]|uniref:Ribonucleotide reductase of class III (Anaerobic), activating protein n=1 Tax=Mucinivorans hirudinis TaxID=1433126 RepID=A0A060RB97_9BACT|nr:Ribonucleotide reductase of class III (anaerobic), activating protein [Mucinivorans hirudinis]
MKYYNYDIVFAEIPAQTTLAINLADCPNRCPGCHSPWLQQQQGTELTTDTLSALIDYYHRAITCVCFMGGDNDHSAVVSLARFVAEKYEGLRRGWYSGCDELPADFPIGLFDYIKLGRYVQELGDLTQTGTNQRLYNILDGQMYPMTVAKGAK